MSQISTLRQQVNRALRAIERKRQGEPLIEFETCWGDEIPDSWEPGSYYIADWNVGSLEESESEGEDA